VQHHANGKSIIKMPDLHSAIECYNMVLVKTGAHIETAQGTVLQLILSVQKTVKKLKEVPSVVDLSPSNESQ
jgi:hypothetical protein